MKKIVFLIVAVVAGMVTYAQSLDDVKESLTKSDLAKSKELVDKYLSNPKNAAKPDGWYYKGYIYNGISKNEALKASCPDCKMEAFNAFKKYQELDKKNILMLLEQNASLFDIYNNYFDIGAKAYNSKNYDVAFTNFKNGLLVKDYIYSKGFDYNGYKFPAIDTSLVLNAATAAVLAKREDDAITYYKILTDGGLTGKDYLVAYEYLADYAKKKKDMPAFYAALDLGRKVYPQEDYWTAIEMELIGESGTKEEAFAKYDAMFKKYPNDYLVGYNYSVELYNYLFVSDDSVKKDPAYKVTLQDILKKVIAIKSTGEANILLARYYYNEYYDKIDLAKKVKGAKPADIAKRKSINDDAIASLNACAPYCEAADAYFAALPKLRPIEKANYKQSLSMLQGIYEIKKDMVKSAAYAAKIKELE